MESANHEFTWLSGRAHLSYAGETKGGGAVGSGGRKSHQREKSISSDPGNVCGKPRSNCDSQVNKSDVNTASKSEEKITKPTPLPRIFKRLTSTDQSKTSTQIYEVPPSLDKSVFYVATPKDVTVNNIKSSESPTLRASNSIILEFDPILQKQEEEKAEISKRLSSQLLGNLNMSTQVSETPTLPLKNPSKSSFYVYEELQRPNVESVERVLEKDGRLYEEYNSSGIYDVPRKTKLTRSASSTSSNASVMSSNSSTSSRHQIFSRQNKHSTDEHSSADVSPSGLKKFTPIPKPRTKHNGLNNSAPLVKKCSLSSVVPAPSQVYEKEPTHEIPILLQTSAVENNLYMLCENGFDNSLSAKSESVAVINLNVSNISLDKISDSSSLDGGGFAPPSFPPPPPPPPDYNENVVIDVPSAASRSKNMQKVVNEIESLNSRVSAPPKPPRNMFSPAANSAANNVCNNNAGSGIEPKSKYHVYHNLLPLCGDQGVYGKINKTPVKVLPDLSPSTESTVDRPSVQEPPPLPPRGQQQRTPGFKILAELVAAKRKSANFDGSLYISSDSTTSNNRDYNISENQRNSYHGMLYKIGKSRKDITQKWVVLERGHLQCYIDDKTDSPQDVFHKSDIVSVAKGTDVKHSNLDLKCFEVVSIKFRDRPQVFGARYLSEREVWMRHLVQSLAPQSDSITNGRGVNKAGYVLLRKSVTGSFGGCWIVLQGRQMEISYDDYIDNFTIDLRKVISMQEFEQDPQMSAMTDEGPVFVIHYPSLTIYIRSTVAFDTLNWFQRILSVTKETGTGLEDQQLTHDDVPVIVDKCIKFVSTFGITSKGIYRESATNSKITKLLDSFCKDAQKTDLKNDDHSEHEVANVLKRFFRLLPDPLLTKNLYSKWIDTVAESFSLEKYKSLLNQLPAVNYQTLKKLMAHLKSVSERSEHNLMNATNLAQVFGPTILSNEKDVNMANSTFEIEVMLNLIENYFLLFGVSEEEIEKEEMIQKALKDLRDARKAQKPAGDILVGIYIYCRQQKCLNVKLSPIMTAYELCKHAAQQARMREKPENLTVFEIVCGGDLERPLHYSEIVLSVTLRWATWSDSDAKDNYLVIKSNDILQRVLPLTRQPVSTFGELKFATIKAKSFKKMLFEFKNARLAYYKDAKITQPIESWNIEDITWYIGAESKRHATWCITFIEQKAVVKRGSKDAPFFGRTICFSGEVEFNKWVASMLIGQYPNGIIPKIEHFDLLT